MYSKGDLVMRIKGSELRKIIKEEISRVVNEEQSAADMIRSADMSKIFVDQDQALSNFISGKQVSATAISNRGNFEYSYQDLADLGIKSYGDTEIDGKVRVTVNPDKMSATLGDTFVSEDGNRYRSIELGGVSIALVPRAAGMQLGSPPATIKFSPAQGMGEPTPGDYFVDATLKISFNGDRISSTIQFPMYAQARMIGL